MTRHHAPNVDGSTSVSVSIDLGQAPVPDRRYAADFASVLLDDYTIKLCFGQHRIGGGVRSLLIVHLSYGAFGSFLRGFDDFVDQVREYAERAALPKVQLVDLKEEPAQTVALTANIVAASYAGRDAVLDFYHASAFVLSEIKNGAPFMAEPVVRVNLNTAAIMPLWERLAAIRDSLPATALEEL